jgi:hypothetical protein
MKMRRIAKGRGRRAGYGPPFAGPGRGGMIKEFFVENPDCADKMARYGVLRMRQDGFSDDEIREHVTHIQRRGFLPDLEIQDLLN